MSRKAAISTLWGLTIGSFVLVQFVGVVVVISIFFERGSPRYQVLGAYIIFLLFSGIVWLAAQRVRKMVQGMYGE